MAKLKIAIVGVGSISNFHIKAYQRNPDVELYAFCDINADRLEMMGKKYDITRLYTDEKTMLEELPELDAVSVLLFTDSRILTVSRSKALSAKRQASKASTSRLYFSGYSLILS